MILEYTCENFKSIKNKVTFSMLASKDNTFEDHLISFNGLVLIKLLLFMAPMAPEKPVLLSL